ncbi:hypothetical protein AVEN_155079-1 [Araneus ventricosus]|uniref:Uncharacterized protein n=1 Tax=Araneus ventricosus TaxID=182803 RepID=A0A4Y2A7I4_ARAVE|nr:hypothetical protein AVEN_155079-1 [Araneus ventricosus]
MRVEAGPYTVTLAFPPLPHARYVITFPVCFGSCLPTDNFYTLESNSVNAPMTQRQASAALIRALSELISIVVNAIFDSLKPAIHLKDSHAICPKPGLFSPPILIEKYRHAIHFYLEGR